MMGVIHVQEVNNDELYVQSGDHREEGHIQPAGPTLTVYNAGSL